MTTISDPSFESNGFTYWSPVSNGSASASMGTAGGGYYVTAGTYGVQEIIGGGAVSATYVNLEQSINFNSNFTLTIDFKFTETNAGLYVRVLVDNTVFYTSPSADNSTHANVAFSIYDIYGTHTLKLQVYFPAGTLAEHTAFFDNLRISSEVTISTDIYVDINKANDTGDGLSWANAKKTMNAGYTILAPTGTMHVATGDYSPQTTITYNKSWSLSPEDPNSVGNKTVSIAKST